MTTQRLIPILTAAGLVSLAACDGQERAGTYQEPPPAAAPAVETGEPASVEGTTGPGVGPGVPPGVQPVPGAMPHDTLPAPDPRTPTPPGTRP